MLARTNFEARLRNPVRFILSLREFAATFAPMTIFMCTVRVPRNRNSSFTARIRQDSRGKRPQCGVQVRNVQESIAKNENGTRATGSFESTNGYGSDETEEIDIVPSPRRWMILLFSRERQDHRAYE